MAGNRLVRLATGFPHCFAIANRLVVFTGQELVSDLVNRQEPVDAAALYSASRKIILG